MEQTITCFCEHSWTEDVPGEIDLDLTPDYLSQILEGSFLTFPCPLCGKRLQPEFPLRVLWPSRHLRLEVLPELDRGAFYRRRKSPRDPGDLTETVIGYPEMADRLAVLRDGLEPAAMEVLKYYLLQKAEETSPDREVRVSYAASDPRFIEFHLSGLRDGEMGVSKVPRHLYEKALEDYRKQGEQRKEPGGLFGELRVGSYLSVSNTLRPREFR